MVDPLHFVLRGVHEIELALIFAAFVLTKKLDSMLLLRLGAWAASPLFTLPKDPNAVNGFIPSNASLPVTPTVWVAALEVGTSFGK
uniref:Uncharacterized protein n=1 Tax=Lotus japonicus TaxID=34305 RepID=I3S0D2_LOTJA|nr:unknown [Lotus japonicus]